jgi:hypothetical protein
LVPVAVPFGGIVLIVPFVVPVGVAVVEPDVADGLDDTLGEVTPGEVTLGDVVSLGYVVVVPVCADAAPVASRTTAAAANHGFIAEPLGLVACPQPTPAEASASPRNRHAIRSAAARSRRDRRQALRSVELDADAADDGAFDQQHA